MHRPIFNPPVGGKNRGLISYHPPTERVQEPAKSTPWGVPGLLSLTRRGIFARSGEDGGIRAWTAHRGKPCGSRRFVALLDPAAAGSGGDAVETASRVDGEARLGARGEAPVPLCSLAASPVQPLLAVGTCRGTAHLVFVTQVNSGDAPGSRCLGRGRLGSFVLARAHGGGVLA